MVERDGNRFAAVPVRLGQRYGQQLEILDGLDVTDAVVTSGQFLLDAEANLDAGVSRMDADAVTTTVGSAP